MSELWKIRRGTRAEYDAVKPLSLAEMSLITDEDKVVIQGLVNEISLTDNPVTDKVHTATVVGNRISIVTGGKYVYEDGNQLQFISPVDIVAPVTAIFDNGAELAMLDLEGNAFDLVANTVYIAIYKDGGTPVFQSAPRGGGGGIVTGDVTPIYGQQEKTGSEIDKTTPLTVVAQPYDTSGNGGRKLVRLDDGTHVSVVTDGSNYKAYKSINNGDTWSLVFTSTQGDIGDVSIVPIDNQFVYIVFGRTTGFQVRGNKLDIINSTIVDSAIDSGQTAMGNCSLTIAPNGDLHACWLSKNSGDPNSFNIRYSKSTNGGVTWETPQQVTSNNTTGQDHGGVNVVIDSNGNPILIASFTTSTFSRIQSHYFNGSIWLPVVIYDSVSGSYIQANPSADVLSDGTIVAAWEGLGVSETSKQIRFSQSTDNGITWSAMELLTSGNSEGKIRPSLTRNDQDKIFIMYSNFEGGRTELIEGNSGNFGSPVTIDTHNAVSISNPSTVSNYREFTKPISIYMDSSSSDVKFYGKWGSFTINNIDLATVLQDSYIYVNEPCILNLSGGGTQNIPSVNTATDEDQLKAVANGILRTTGSTVKQYVGNVSKDSLGFMPIT